MTSTNPGRKLVTAAAVIIAAIGLTTTGASAHVTIGDVEQTPGAYTVLTVSVPHGCDGSATTGVRIQMPEEIPAVTPTINPGWDVDVVMTDLDEPIEDDHGAQITERAAEVVYTTDTPLPDDRRDAFELSVQMPDLPGETLYFPTIQTCEDGETGWVEIPGDGVDAHDLDEPAPAVTLVPGDTDAVGADEVAAAPDRDTESADSDGSSNTLAIIALIVGLAGLGLGGAAFAAGRRNT